VVAPWKCDLEASIGRKRHETLVRFPARRDRGDLQKAPQNMENPENSHCRLLPLLDEAGGSDGGTGLSAP
jgi:hypothetical protein